MLVNLDDVAFWMDAVRNSENHYGVLESFWKGQLKSNSFLSVLVMIILTALLFMAVGMAFLLA